MPCRPITWLDPVDPGHVAAAQRRELYIAARSSGALPADAAREAGLSGVQSTTQMYERWYQAVRRGEHFLTQAPTPAAS